MNGISPRPRFFMQPEQQISSAVSTAVPDLPLVVADLIAEYTNEDYSQAAQALVFDDAGTLDNSAENRAIYNAIKKALASPFCDPAIKRSIFENHNKHRLIESNYAAVLNTIFDEIRSDNEQVKLDNVDFSTIHLVRLNLSGASMVATKFNNSLIHMTDLTYANLTDAEINNSDFTQGNMTAASLVRATIFNVMLTQIDMVRTDATGANLVRADFNCIAADGMITDDEQLQSMLDGSVRNLDEVIDGSEMDNYLKSRFLVHPKPESNSITILNDQFVRQ